MAVDVIASLGAFKTIFDLAKGLKDINDATIRNTAVIELHDKILAAKVEQSELIERNSELEKELAILKAWDAEKERYELVQIAPGVVAYAQKESVCDHEPFHYLCANCYIARGRNLFSSNAVSGAMRSDTNATRMVRT
ncbi:MAG: hypothetical protein ACREC0_07730 [Methylocella sp.]